MYSINGSLEKKSFSTQSSVSLSSAAISEQQEDALQLQPTTPPIPRLYTDVDPQLARTGGVVLMKDFCSSMMPDQGFARFSTYTQQYPILVGQAIASLCDDYHEVFTNIIEDNRESPDDYQATIYNGVFVNPGLQVDMAALDPEILARCSQSDCTLDEAKALIKPTIFEFENSLAMLNLLENMFTQKHMGAPEEGLSQFKAKFRETLQIIREKTGKKVALVTLSEEKNRQVLSSELGHTPEQPLSADRVKALIGFDDYLSPAQFLEHAQSMDFKDSSYVFFFRPSVDQKSRSNSLAEAAKINGLLADDQLRAYAKRFALTPLDSPDCPAERQAVDTKKYLAPMDMAFEAGSSNSVFSQDYHDWQAILEDIDRKLQDIRHEKDQMDALAKQMTKKAFGQQEAELGQQKGQLKKQLGQLKKVSPDDKAQILTLKKSLVAVEDKIAQLRKDKQRLVESEHCSQYQKLNKQKSFLDAAKRELQAPDHKLSNSFSDYLTKIGLTEDDVCSGRVMLRVKPRDGAYGCYGHLRLDFSKPNNMEKLKLAVDKEIQVIQPEIPMRKLKDIDSEAVYGITHRNFCLTDAVGKMRFVGGFMMSLPVDTKEFKNNRGHGNNRTVWGAINLVKQSTNTP